MGSPLCILLVDDSKFFLEFETQLLRHTPATVVTATSGDEALRVAAEQRPSLIYLDLDMPEMDGLACCRALKSSPQLSGIPVVLIGDQAVSREAEARAAGAEAFLSKPLDRRQFLGVGHAFLAGIDRREPRRNCRLPVAFTCRGRRLEGSCIDLSSGGMFLVCTPTAQKDERLLLRFTLPDSQRSGIELHGRIAWVNRSEKMIKQDYPLGYGIEFVDIDAASGRALRRCFGT